MIAAGLANGCAADSDKRAPRLRHELLMHFAGRRGGERRPAAAGETVGSP